MRRAARTDHNQSAVVKALRSVGCSVLDMSGLGDGAPDLAVGLRGCNWFLELKDGGKSPSRRKLTPAQVEFQATWRGQWAKVETPEQAIEVVTRTNPTRDWIDVTP